MGRLVYKEKRSVRIQSFYFMSTLGSYLLFSLSIFLAILFTYWTCQWQKVEQVNNTEVN